MQEREGERDTQTDRHVRMCVYARARALAQVYVNVCVCAQVCGCGCGCCFGEANWCVPLTMLVGVCQCCTLTAFEILSLL